MRRILNLENKEASEREKNTSFAISNLKAMVYAQCVCVYISASSRIFGKRYGFFFHLAVVWWCTAARRHLCTYHPVCRTHAAHTG